MKISVEDGIVVCSLEDTTPFQSVKRRFLRRAGVYFDGFYKDKLRLSQKFGCDSSRYGSEDRGKTEIQWEKFMIGSLMLAAEEEGVIIDESAHAWLSARLAVLDEQIKDREEREYYEREERRLSEKLENLLTRGCSTSCKYKSCGAFCEALEKWLGLKPVLVFYNGRPQPYVSYKAFPSEGCPCIKELKNKIEETRRKLCSEKHKENRQN